MRPTITLNGQESSEIEGLLIQSLPPISKPLIRTQIEEIDGRDGDVITKLGFSAYNKEITIGLYGDFDIDAIIAYFNSEGVVTFSNEPEKYYYYQIIDQIDFERLIRYRTATVTMHCQPFKYSTVEGADILSASGNFATLDQSINTDAQYFTYTSNVQADVTASRNNVATGSKFFATFTMNVVEGITYYFSGDTSTPVTMYGYKDRIWGTSAGFSGRKLTNAFKYTATYTGQLIIGFYGSGSDLYIRNFNVTNESGANVSGEGNDFVLENTSEAPFTQFDLKGDTDQQTYSGKNLFNTQNRTTLWKTEIVSKTDNELTIKPTAQGGGYVDFNIPAAANTQYTLSLQFSVTGASGSYEGVVYIYAYNGSSETYLDSAGPNYPTKIITTRSDTTTLRFRFYSLQGNDNTWENIRVTFSNIQVELGSTATSYEPYVGGIPAPNPDYPQDVQVVTGEQTITITDDDEQSQTFTVNLGSLELCKIGDYQDYFYKDGDDWYLHKEVGHASLAIANMDNSNAYPGWKNQTAIKSDLTTATSGNPARLSLFTSYITNISGTVLYGSSEQNPVNTNFNSGNALVLLNNDFWGSDHTQTYWQTNYPDLTLELYYGIAVEASQTDTQITDATLISQLNAVAEAHAYDGTTHITATTTGTNLPHIIAASVGSSIDGTITNSGNTTARPKLTLFGSGTIGIYLNGNQIFNVNLGTQGHITIDTNAMEAYQDTTDNLMNRLVDGDYSNFVLQTGENQISFSGSATMCVVENYSRWI